MITCVIAIINRLTGLIILMKFSTKANINYLSRYDPLHGRFHSIRNAYNAGHDLLTLITLSIISLTQPLPPSIGLI